MSVDEEEEVWQGCGSYIQLDRSLDQRKAYKVFIRNRCASRRVWYDQISATHQKTESHWFKINILSTITVPIYSVCTLHNALAHADGYFHALSCK